MSGLFTDCYSLTMANADFIAGKQNEIGRFDLFYRDVPENGGYSIFCGLAKAFEDIKNLKFTEDELAYLKQNWDFCDEYLSALRNFKFACEIMSVPEGTPIFPNEPFLTVTGPMWQAMLIEVLLLNAINHQSLIATKASRIVRAAAGRRVLEFGARRAQGADAAIWGSRAAFVGGVDGVSVVEAGARFGMPVSGTMAHSFMQKYNNDYDAFVAYAQAFPDNCILLLDTFDTLKSGLPAAIRVHKELGADVKAVRIDSGDLGYLAKRIRDKLDKNGMESTKIIATNALDEMKIRDLIADQNAPIDIFGVGENLITSSAAPVFGGVYKLATVGGQPRIKISENSEKTTIPGMKMTYRLFDNVTGKAIADVITLADEPTPSGPYELFDPADPTKRKTVDNFTAKSLLEPVGEIPSAINAREYATAQKETLWDEVKRFNFPHKYYVDLSLKLWNLREDMIKASRGKQA